MRIQSNSPATSDNSNQTLKELSNSGIAHPFTKETVAVNGSVVTSGNLNLQHLSLSCKFSLRRVLCESISVESLPQITCLHLVNRLTNKTLKKLVSCLRYQNYMLLGDCSRGLLHVFLEGNDIERDEDWTAFQELLRRRRQNGQATRDGVFKDFEDSAMSVESEILRSKVGVRLHLLS
ncbi:PREDICTED: uncharacterized protein LOC105567178 [Vollenhovia emeryi]|uniref:uncharacterized protein LOC105567178 n=1 Tax=Vollenhovia emeryi TaxID=411798 RepID=UPI0005F385E7|nr:PREDICTED: uncharacterized protein LOC105567178 [Vollenhovia emeryi]